MEPSAEAAETRDRHRDFYLNVAERALIAWSTGQETALFEELEAEQDNLRAALAWSERQGDAEQFVRLTTSLRLFWESRGRFEEGGRWMGAALAHQDETPAAVRAHLLTSAAQMATYLNDFAQEALDLFVAQTYQPMLARTVEAIAFTAALRGLAAQAVTLFGAMEPFRERIGVPMPPAYHHLYRQALGAAHAALDEAPFAGAWAEGRSLPIELAIERARALCR